MEFCCCSKIFILTHAADASLIRRELDTLIGPFFLKNPAFRHNSCSLLYVLLL